MRFMDTGRARSPASTVSSRAPATPARTVLRFRFRPHTPRRWRRRCWKTRTCCRSAWAPATAFAAAGRALSLWPRHRHHDHPGRGRAGMVGAEEPPHRRGARRRFPRRGEDPRPFRKRRGAPPRRLAPRGPRAGARRRAAVCGCHRRRAGRHRKVTSGGFGPSLNAPVAMGYVPARLGALGTKLFRRGARPAPAAHGRRHAAW